MLEFSDNIHSDLPYIQLEWVVSDQICSNQPDIKVVSLPVYLDNSRSNALFNIDFAISNTSESSLFFLQGVAIYANMYSN
ncbi:hypothetical protein MXB_4467 [Myxobolus squamalis]|nr:hypothetical protein MXB_4467 [Myxobolus squamalis]